MPMDPWLLGVGRAVRLHRRLHRSFMISLDHRLLFVNVRTGIRMSGLNALQMCASRNMSVVGISVGLLAAVSS